MPENDLNQKEQLTHMMNHLDIFICPVCGGDLMMTDNSIKCLGCSKQYRCWNGIPLLFWSNEWGKGKEDITDTIKSFYEKTPFPNYEDSEDVDALMQKAKRGVFARLLDEQTPLRIRVLEAGCGTGQLSNFLGIAHRYVFGTDMCLNSLKLAQDFKIKNDLERVGFYQMNLFRPIFRKESFHLVICNGVLHHTSNPFLGFQSIAGLVKKGGHIILGLYNRYGRLATDVRRFVFNMSKDRFKFLDSRLRNRDVGDVRKSTWFRDQYKNPHESKHTIGEVLKWLDSTGFEFINGIPKAVPCILFSARENLFNANPKGNWLDHFLVQAKLSFTGSREGGFFLIIAKKKV